MACRGLKLDFILNTHHHWDHTGGNEELKSKFNCTVVGPKADKGRIPGIDIALADGESWQFGDLKMEVFDTPGHTRPHQGPYHAVVPASRGTVSRQACTEQNLCSSMPPGFKDVLDPIVILFVTLSQFIWVH